jgi:hypothetical protein
MWADPNFSACSAGLIAFSPTFPYSSQRTSPDSGNVLTTRVAAAACRWCLGDISVMFFHVGLLRPWQLTLPANVWKAIATDNLCIVYLAKKLH